MSPDTTPCVRSLGHGVVKFSAVAEAHQAVEMLSSRLLCNRALDVRLAAGPRPGGPTPSGQGAQQLASGFGDPSPSPNLYIKGLPPGTTDVGLRNVFAPFGTILDSRILYPESSAPSALLRYTTVQEAAAAIAAMNGVTPPGAVNMLQVRFAESAADKARRAAQVGTRPAGLTGPGISKVGTVHLPSGVEAIEKVECPPTLVGWLIGRSGETIKTLQQRSGCVLSIDQTMGEGQPRIVNIAGTREQVTLGRQLVEELLASGAARSGSSWAPPAGQQSNSYGGGGGDPSYYRGPPPPGQPATHVPSTSALPAAPMLALPAPRAPEPEEADPCVDPSIAPTTSVISPQFIMPACVPSTERRQHTTLKTEKRCTRRPWSAKTICQPPCRLFGSTLLCLSPKLFKPRSASLLLASRTLFLLRTSNGGCVMTACEACSCTGSSLSSPRQPRWRPFPRR